MPVRVYVGTYTKMEPYARGRGQGLVILDLDRDTGALAVVDVVPGVVNPSFLALSPDGRAVYVVNEVPELDGHAGGGVSTFLVDDASGALTFHNRQPSGGSDPCHVSVDATGRYVFVANYSSGTVSAFRVEPGGGLSGPRVVRQHEGKGPNRDRQEGPHAHQIVPDPLNRFALANDLGTDQVVVYRLEYEDELLVPHDPPVVQVHPGAGPRHLAFHPNVRFFYVINELDSTVTACQWDGEQGTVRPFQMLSTVPDDFTGGSSCADVHVAPSGRFLYGSNRGHDSIAVFEIDPVNGDLRVVGFVSTEGRTPRGFALDSTGNLIIVANQESDTIVSFRVDPDTGMPAPTGYSAAVPSPVCVKIADGRFRTADVAR